jgi:hypothetical protein
LCEYSNNTNALAAKILQIHQQFYTTEAALNTTFALWEEK